MGGGGVNTIFSIWKLVNFVFTPTQQIQNLQYDTVIGSLPEAYMIDLISTGRDVYCATQQVHWKV